MQTHTHNFNKTAKAQKNKIRSIKSSDKKRNLSYLKEFRQKIQPKGKPLSHIVNEGRG